MSDSEGFPKEVHISVRMQQALDAFKQMSRAEQLHIMLKTGLMTEAEYQQALERPAATKKPRRKPSKSRASSVKNPKKPATS